MSNSRSEKAAMHPIEDEDISDVGIFLQNHMYQKYSAEEWERRLRVCWHSHSPNHGFMLRTNDGVVGVICAIYSEQVINGKSRNICNPHTWCVLEPYRGSSVSLVLAIIRQKGFDFTMFSPNKAGEEIFAYLGFKPLEREMKILINVPMLNPLHRGTVFSSDKNAVDRLPVQALKCYRDHRQFNWLQFLFYERDGRCGFLIYKREMCLKLPCAHIMYISDKSLFMDCLNSIRTSFLVSHGLITCKVEKRLLPEIPSFTLEAPLASAKFYLSEELPPESIDYIYSELVAMDL